MLITATFICVAQSPPSDDDIDLQILESPVATSAAWGIGDITGADELAAARAVLLDPGLEAAHRRAASTRWARLRRDVQANTERVMVALDVVAPRFGDTKMWGATPFLDGSGVQLTGRAGEVGPSRPGPR